MLVIDARYHTYSIDMLALLLKNSEMNCHNALRNFRFLFQFEYNTRE